MFLVLLFLSQISEGYSQTYTHKVVTDATTGRGIPYATIKVVNKPDGTYADSTGLFKVKTDKSDSLLVTCVGYRTKTTTALLDTIFLNPVFVKLDEVSIRTTKPKEQIVGLVDAKRVGTFYFCGNVNDEISVMIKIPDSFTYYRIKGVKFKSKHENGASLLRLHIYSQKDDGTPDKEILPQDLMINNNLKSNGQIDLSRFNLICIDRVLFVGVEDIKANTKLDTKNLDECIGIGMTAEDKQDLTFHRSLLDPKFKWKKSLFGQKRNGNPKNLMISLIID